MQSLKKKLLTILSLSLFIVLAGNYNVLAKMEENGENSNNACEVLTSEEPMLNKEYVNENNEIIYKNRNGKNGFISVTFSFLKERKITRLREILNDLNFDYKESKYETNRKQTLFTVKVPSTLIITKNFKDWINLVELSYDFSREFIQELKYWDGWDYDRNTFGYDTTSKDNADIVEAIAIIGGYKSSYKILKSTEISFFGYRLSCLGIE